MVAVTTRMVVTAPTPMEGNDPRMRPTGGEEPSSDPSVRARRILRATEREAEAVRREITVRRGAARDAALRDTADASDAARQADRLEVLGAEAGELAVAALGQVRDLCAAVDAVVHALREAEPDPAVPEPEPLAPTSLPASAPRVDSGSPDPPDPPVAPRFVAIEMAVGGASRADVDRHLRARFDLTDTGPVLDGVFGPDTGGSARLGGGR